MTAKRRPVTDPRGGTWWVTTEVLPARGRVVYDVATRPAGKSLGCLTVERDPHHAESAATDGGPPTRYIHVAYGRDDTRNVHQCAQDRLPVVNGVTIAGGAVFDPQHAVTQMESTDWYRVAVHRAETAWYAPDVIRSGSSAPAATSATVTALVVAVAVDYCGRDDLDALNHAQDVDHAPARLTEYRRRLATLDEQIASLQGEYAQVRGHADRHAALAAEHPDVDPLALLDVG